VFFDYFKFLYRQLGRLEQDTVGDGYFADVVQLGRLDDRIGIYGIDNIIGVFLLYQILDQHLRVGSGPFDVRSCLIVAEGRHIGKDAENGILHMAELLCADGDKPL
jgi:hypothetical protein